jgi:hypothetical protein
VARHARAVERIAVFYHLAADLGGNRIAPMPSRGAAPATRPQRADQTRARTAGNDRRVAVAEGGAPKPRREAARRAPQAQARIRRRALLERRLDVARRAAGLTWAPKTISRPRPRLERAELDREAAGDARQCSIDGCAFYGEIASTDAGRVDKKQIDVVSRRRRGSDVAPLLELRHEARPSLGDALRAAARRSEEAARAERGAVRREVRLTSRSGTRGASTPNNRRSRRRRRPAWSCATSARARASSRATRVVRACDLPCGHTCTRPPSPSTESREALSPSPS